jgi:hypothetical protein
MSRITSIVRGSTVSLQFGDHFDLLLPDGTTLNVELTGDDFSITKTDGVVAYTRPVSESAKQTDVDMPTVTGRK